MAQPATNPKIEELRGRLKADPKSRLFFPLAEELRKAGEVGEAEQVLRSGLSVHATYLSAWVSLGRVLRDLRKDAEAVDALTRALQLDPGNVVAARLLGDAYLALGEKVEAIKKYKLVHALLPADQDLEAQIAALDRELNPPTPAAVAPVEEAAEPAADAGAATTDSPFATDDAAAELPAATPESRTPLTDSPFALSDDANPFADAAAAREDEHRMEEATADVEPMYAAHDSSPFEEPVATAYTAAAVAVEDLGGFHVDRAPLAADVPTPVMETFAPPVESEPVSPEAIPVEEAADVFAPAAVDVFAVADPRAATTADETVADPFALAAEPIPEPAAAELTNTITMADIYVSQGLVDDARHIYESILARDPANAAVRAKLDALLAEPAPPAAPAAAAKIRRLEEWLVKVKRRAEVGRV